MELVGQVQGARFDKLPDRRRTKGLRDAGLAEGCCRLHIGVAPLGKRIASGLDQARPERDSDRSAADHAGGHDGLHLIVDCGDTR